MVAFTKDFPLEKKDKLEKEKPRPSRLELSLVPLDKNRLYYSVPIKQNSYITTQNQDRDYVSGALYVDASSNSMSDGVKGFYVPSSHTISLSPSLSSRERIFVAAHERAHALGVIDEAQADARAAAEVGYHVRYFGDPSTYQGLR